MNVAHRLSLLLAGLALVLAACSTPQTSAPAPAQPQPPAAAAPQAPLPPANLAVDHAWVRDAESPDEQAAQAASMDALRAKVAAGGGFNDSWNSLGLDGSNWHVAEGETYPSDVLPEAVRDLPAGTVTPVVPGDGGLHLFRIISRTPPE